MILSAEELQKIVRLLRDLNEATEIALKELIDRKIAEAFDQHLEDYEHKEKHVDSALASYKNDV